jgi:hypothetical protein|tara:strand:+ start:3560 stop:3979 length:420 start_codon:yes stop_codon:yes gene_type:complete
LYGFEAIAAHNGWSMAIVGASIVFSGLVILSLVISQLHKLLTIWENKGTFFNRNKRTSVNSTEEVLDLNLPGRFPSDINEAARLYHPLVEKLGQPFQLVQLYEVSRKKGFPHPHLTISLLRQAKVLVPEGDGVFIWNHP